MQNTLSWATTTEWKLLLPNTTFLRAGAYKVEYKNGEPVDIPDNKRSKFKTPMVALYLMGRHYTRCEIARARTGWSNPGLADQKMIFLYTKWLRAQTRLHQKYDDFAFTAYDDFVSFLKKKNFSYKKQAEQEIKALQQKCNEKRELKSLIGADLKSHERQAWGR